MVTRGNLQARTRLVQHRQPFIHESDEPAICSLDPDTLCRRTRHPQTAADRRYARQWSQADRGRKQCTRNGRGFRSQYGAEESGIAQQSVSWGALDFIQRVCAPRGGRTKKEVIICVLKRGAALGNGRETLLTLPGGKAEARRLHRLTRVGTRDKANTMPPSAQLPRCRQSWTEMARASPRCHQKVVGHGFALRGGSAIHELSTPIRPLAASTAILSALRLTIPDSGMRPDRTTTV